MFNAAYSVETCVVGADAQYKKRPKYTNHTSKPSQHLVGCSGHLHLAFRQKLMATTLISDDPMVPVNT